MTALIPSPGTLACTAARTSASARPAFQRILAALVDGWVRWAARRRIEDEWRALRRLDPATRRDLGLEDGVGYEPPPEPSTRRIIDG